MKKLFTIATIALFAISANAQHVQKTMTYDGTQRKYAEYIPTQSADGTMPVVFFLHGLGDDCANFSSALQFEATAPNWIIITPEALPASVSLMGQSMSLGNAWAAGVGAEDISLYGFSLGTIELNADVDDEGFLMALLDSVAANYSIDTDSIFFSGFSMGGFMTNKMAIKHADRIKAVASVSGTIGHFTAFEPTANINTMHLHGTADGTIGYENADFSIYGASASVGTGAEATVEAWRNYNQCGTQPEIHYFEDTKNDGLTFEQYTYKNETTGKKTAFIKVNGGDHYWYDGINNDIDYNTEIYKFFIGDENQPTNAQDNLAATIDIFPNPASDIINITSADDSELVIYDNLSREIARQPLHSGFNTISTANLTDGIYFFNISGRVQKVIISK